MNTKYIYISSPKINICTKNSERHINLMVLWGCLTWFCDWLVLLIFERSYLSNVDWSFFSLWGPIGPGRPINHWHCRCNKLILTPSLFFILTLPSKLPLDWNFATPPQNLPQKNYDLFFSTYHYNFHQTTFPVCFHSHLLLFCLGQDFLELERQNQCWLLSYMYCLTRYHRKNVKGEFFKLNPAFVASYFNEKKVND